MNEENEDILETILKDKLLKLYVDKPHEELLELVIRNEIKVINCQKEIENLKFQNYQLMQKVIDTKHESIANNQSAKRIKNKYGQYHEEKQNYYKDNLLVPNESFVKKELSIYNDTDDLNIEEDDLMQFSFKQNASANKNIESILFVSLNEIKLLLKNVLIENNLFDPNDNNDMDHNLQPYEIQMNEIKKSILKLNNIQNAYKSLFIDYSNQLLMLIQNNIIDKIDKKLDENNLKFKRLNNIFINE